MGDVVLFFDTETTGLPLCSSASVRMAGNWPDVVQLAYTTSDSDEIVCEYLAPTQPLSDGSVRVHGITREFLAQHGSNPREVYERFLKTCARCGTLAAHNLSFDLNVVLAQLHRLGIPSGNLPHMRAFCTMRAACNLVKAKPRLLHGKMMYKYPRLEECAAAL